jgi:Tfp pilus assembly protein PilF
MGNLWKIAAALALVIGIGVAALVFTGIWPGPSAADQERARALQVEAQAQLQAGDQDAALASLNESIDLAPHNDALRTRASIHIARNDFENAERDISKAISRGNALAADYSLRCWLRARGEALNQARNDCDRAIEMNPSLAAAFGNRGLVGLRQNRNPEAWTDFNTALRIGGEDEWVAWRLFGRGLAAIGRGTNVQGRQDIDTAIRLKPGVAADYAAFGVGGEVIRELDDAAYAASEDQGLEALEHYLAVYPTGAHAAEAQTRVADIHAWIAEQQAAGRAALPGFNLTQVRGPGARDSFGAIALSRSTWRIAFSTDYAEPMDAMQVAATACNGTAVRDCDAYAFRNVCASLALSRAERARGMAWAYSVDDAVHGALSQCRARGGRNCLPVHTQCTPTPPEPVQTPAAQ